MSELSRAFEFMQSQQAKIDLLGVQLKGAEERAKLILDHKNRMVDELQKENDRLNTWYKNVKLQLENKQIDCDRSDREVDDLQNKLDYHIEANSDLAKLALELQKKYDAMYKDFIVADDCRKEWHESYVSARKDRDELQERVDKAMKYVSESPLKDVSRRAMINFVDILKGNKDEN